jgi:hypothetical protein
MGEDKKLIYRPEVILKGDTVYSSIGFGPNALHGVRILRDGSLWNPNGYPEERIREAVLAANERHLAKRSKAAQEGAKTRAARQQRQTAQLVKRYLSGQHIVGPLPNCAICGKAIDDQQSIERGVGSDCWQKLLQAVEEEQKAGAA